jgi:hypothetical protein
LVDLHFQGEQNTPGTYVIVWKNLNQDNQRWEIIAASTLLKEREQPLENPLYQQIKQKTPQSPLQSESPEQQEPLENQPLVPCPKCKGNGGIGDFGAPIDVADKNCKEKCPTCDGQKLTKRTRPCAECRALGGMGQFGPCDKTSIFYQRPCFACSGKCYY